MLTSIHKKTQELRQFPFCPWLPRVVVMEDCTALWNLQFFSSWWVRGWVTASWVGSAWCGQGGQRWGCEVASFSGGEVGGEISCWNILPLPGQPEETSLNTPNAVQSTSQKPLPRVCFKPWWARRLPDSSEKACVLPEPCVSPFQTIHGPGSQGISGKWFI